MINILSQLLRKTADDIDAGNSNLTEDEEFEIIDKIKTLSAKDKPMSKYQAYTYIGVKRATFDNLVREGKIPKGVKQQGFKELSWYQKDLDKFLKGLKNGNN